VASFRRCTISVKLVSAEDKMTEINAYRDVNMSSNGLVWVIIQTPHGRDNEGKPRGDQWQPLLQIGANLKYQIPDSNGLHRGLKVV
jgi:hypothetical protein